MPGPRFTLCSGFMHLELVGCPPTPPKSGCAAAVVLKFKSCGPPVHMVLRVTLNTHGKVECRHLGNSGTKVIGATKKMLQVADTLKKESGINPSV